MVALFSTSKTGLVKVIVEKKCIALQEKKKNFRNASFPVNISGKKEVRVRTQRHLVRTVSVVGQLKCGYI